MAKLANMSREQSDGLRKPGTIIKVKDEEWKIRKVRHGKYIIEANGKEFEFDSAKLENWLDYNKATIVEGK